MLQLEHRLWVEQVHFAFATPLVFATKFELAMRSLFWVRRIRMRVAGGHLGGEVLDADAAEAADCAGEVLLNEVVAQANGLKDLRAGVRRHGADAHLRHHLQHALTAGLDEVLQGLVRIHAAQAIEVFANHVFDGFEREVWVDCAGAVAHEQRHVVHFARIAALNNEADLGALLLANEVVMNRSSKEQ